MSEAIASKDVSARDLAKVSEISRLLGLDKTPWYKKKNLRMLYFTLVPAALGVEMTSGYELNIRSRWIIVMIKNYLRDEECREGPI